VVGGGCPCILACSDFFSLKITVAFVCYFRQLETSEKIFLFSANFLLMQRSFPGDWSRIETS
jgi:hypothetical protein